MYWKPLSQTMAPQLAHARLVAHHAIQPVSAFAASHLDKDKDHQYANLAWDSPNQCFVSRRVGDLQAGLRLADNAWVILYNGRVSQRLSVGGNTMDDALAWFRAESVLRGAPDRALSLVGYEIPAYDGVLDSPQAHRSELAAWYDNCQKVLTAIAEADERASEVRVWPHHFDIATLIRIDRKRTGGVGMSTGDEAIAEPYLYVTPWPYPELRVGPELPAGEWNKGSWMGALLRGSQLEGHDMTQAFYEAAIDACLNLV